MEFPPLVSLAALVRAEHATTKLVTRLPAGANTQFAAETCSQLLEEYEEESEEAIHLIPTRCPLTGNLEWNFQVIQIYSWLFNCQVNLSFNFCQLCFY